MEEEIKVQAQAAPEPESVVNQIVQNGVSKEELRDMLNEILSSGKTEPDAEAIRRAETEYFTSHLKY